MEHTRRAHAAVAVAVASAGLIAAVPAAPHLQQAGVQLTTAAVELTDFAGSAAAAADLFPALHANFELAASDFQQGLTDLFNLDLLGAVGNFTPAVANILPAIPENILVAAVGGVLGQDFGGYLAFAGDFAVNPPFTDWSSLVPSLTEMFEAGIYEISAGVQNLFALEIADSLYHTFAGLDSLFVFLPAMVFLGVPALVGDSLLELVGL
ncbi:hypothetical protein ABW16_12585 [Mycolicibacter heraklionensis]|uniref:PE family protein n=2 Tax=Mycolicibacter heraklionensis TaxID=512402 RepID=A0ABR5FES0_9MYCO|nr:hypothetical protein ABW16_12585 [Mycolicibacter heraklionensis]